MHNIDPKRWGRPSWDFLFYITLSYSDTPTEEERQNMYNFFMAMGKVIPCEKCRFNFSQHLKKYQLTNSVLKNRYSLLMWLINIHNEICIQNGKKCTTYDEIINRYLGENTGILNTNLVFTLLIVILIIILLVFLKLKN